MPYLDILEDCCNPSCNIPVYISHIVVLRRILCRYIDQRADPAAAHRIERNCPCFSFHPHRSCRLGEHSSFPSPYSRKSLTFANVRIGDEQGVVLVEKVFAKFASRSTGVVFTIFANAARCVIRLCVSKRIESTTFGVSVTFAQATRIRLTDASRSPRTIVVQIGAAFAIQTFGVMRAVASSVDLREREKETRERERSVDELCRAW